MNDVAMQTRCIHCLREHYLPAVIGMSTGEDACAWCGKKSQPMTVADYQAALRAKLGVSE
jgi:hypothetical protein